MNTKLVKQGLLAAFAVTALSISIPAVAYDDDRRKAKSGKSYNSQSYSGNRGGRDHQYRERQRGGKQYHDHRRGHGKQYRDHRRSHSKQYRDQRRGYGIPWAWKQVPGKIVNVGHGRSSNCFRVKQRGFYNQYRAIVTVRYCENYYGNPKRVRGSKRLIRYTTNRHYN